MDRLTGGHGGGQRGRRLKSVLFAVVLVVGGIGGAIGTGVGIGNAAPADTGPTTTPDAAAPDAGVALVRTARADPGLLGASGAPPETAVPTETRDGVRPRAGAASTGPVINATYTIDRTPATPGSVEVTYELRQENLVNFTLVLRDTQTVVSTTGFSNVGGNEWRWRSDSGIDRPTLTFRADANRTGRFGAGYDTVDTANWTFVDSFVYREASYQYFYEAGTERPAYRRQFALAQAGVITDDPGYAYIGPHETTTYLGDQTFTFVTPATGVAVDRRAALGRLDRAGTRFQVGAVDATVTVFAVPDPIRRGGAAFDDEFWVNADSAFDTASGSTYYHEYAHTRQQFADFDGVYGTNMYWFVEGSAEFYQHYLAFKRGELSGDELRAGLLADAEDRDAVLTDIRRNSAGDADYEKGGHVLTALDLKIRNATDGAANISAVFERLNRQPATTFADFKAIVADVAGRSFDAWLETYVAGTAVPTLPDDLGTRYPADERPPDVTGDGRPATDPDGDGSYENLNGDDAFTVLDVAVFLNTFDAGASDPRFFDVSGDGEVTILDVATLLNQL